MKNINKPEILNIEQLFKYKYVVPLYQRNFAWGEEQITQLLLDIFESKISHEHRYFVGSLVVLQRRNGEYEVIDGQQRLTTLALLSYVLQLNVKPEIHYDSRPEVEVFLEQMAKGIQIPLDASTSHFYEAKEILQKEINNLEERYKEKPEFKKKDFRNDFRSFIMEQVCLVLDIMPQNTDVASYFEIMNNRGEQLQEHEIIKGLLLEKLKDCQKLKDCPNLSVLCSKIWDACSQMNERIQKSFHKKIRIELFGKDYEKFIPNDKNYLELFKNIEIKNNYQEYTLDSIIAPGFTYNPTNESLGNDEEKPEDYKEESIIDFPNFLMHVMRLYYGDLSEVGQEDKNEIPLNDKYLLKTYRLIENKINPVEFFYRLLRCRTIFDRYVVMTNVVINNNEEGREWTLLKPSNYENVKNGKEQLIFKNSFGDTKEQKMIIKALSCMQVCHYSRYYKNYLQEILKWFKNRSITDVNGEDYLTMLNNYIYKELQDSKCYFGLKVYNSELQGTKTSHVILDYLDYMIWCLHENNTGLNDNGEEPEWNMIKDIKDFRFQYWNSVEHHYPQKRTEEFKSEKVQEFDLNCLGNIFLIGKSTNSRLSDKNPKDKASLYNNNNKNNLAPNRQLIYTITNENDWKLDEIKQHLSFIEKLYKNAAVILGIEEKSSPC